MKQPKFEIYKAKDGWRWKLKSANGKLIAEGGEAYSKKPEEYTLWGKIMANLNDCEIKMLKVKP